MLRIQRTKSTSRSSEKGLTIVELVLVIVLLGILFPLFSTLLVSMYRDAIYLNDRVKSNSEITQALFYMEENVRNASTFQTAVPGEYSDFYGSHNLGTAGSEAWINKGDSATSRVLITRNYSTTSNTLNSGKQPVFVNSPSFNCTTQIYYQPQLTYVTIYFVKDGTLYRRLLTNKTTALCPGNVQQQKQTCPPYIPDATRDVSCEAYDEVLANNVTNFTVGYYQVSVDGSSAQIDASYVSTDASILSAVDYANVAITVSTRGGELTNTITQRMTKVNQ
jgi:Tfp pilus assembly protein PilE